MNLIDKDGELSPIAIKCEVDRYIEDFCQDANMIIDAELRKEVAIYLLDKLKETTNKVFLEATQQEE